MKESIDLVTLRVIVAAADTGSISAAGDHLNLAVAAASVRVTALEESFGFRVFERSPRGVRLTPNGHILVERGRVVIADADRLYRDMHEYGRGLEGHVRVLANSSSLLEVIPQVLHDFARNNPRIQVEIEESSSPETQSAVLKGFADIGIVDVPVKMRGLHFQNLFTDRLVIIVNTHHRLAGLDEIFLNDVLDEEFIALIESTALSVRLAMSASSADKTLRVRMRMHGFDAVTRMVAAGLGIGMLPVEAIRPQMATLPLKAIALKDSWATRIHHIATRSGVPVSPAARTFIDALKVVRMG